MLKKRMCCYALTMCTALCVMTIPVFAANKDFDFSLNSTTSKESSLGTANKSDYEEYAYITPDASKSNMAIQGAYVNFRVRDNASNYATELLKCHSYERFKVAYMNGKAVKGATYRLFANVSSTNAYPVNLGGRWCP